MSSSLGRAQPVNMDASDAMRKKDKRDLYRVKFLKIIRRGLSGCAKSFDYFTKMLPMRSKDIVAYTKLARLKPIYASFRFERPSKCLSFSCWPLSAVA